MRTITRSRALAEFDGLDFMAQVHLAGSQAKRLKPDSYRDLLVAGDLDPSASLRNIERVRQLCELEAAIGRLERNFEDATAGPRARLALVHGGGAA